MSATSKQISAYDDNQIDDFFTGQSNPQTKPASGKNKKGRKPLLVRIFKNLPTLRQLKHLPKVLSKKERYAFLVLLIVSAIALISIPISIYYHFTESAPAYGGSFTEGMVGTPKYINPLLLQNNDVDSDITRLVYAGLMKYGKDGKLLPDLADSYEVSDDGLKYTFKLKKGAKWHNGEPVTADDIVFTILTAQNPDYASPLRLNWQGVDVEKTDNYTVVFTLKNKYAQFLNNMTIGILPRHIWEKVSAANFASSKNNIEALGSGPYSITKVNRDNDGNIESIELSSFKEYFNGRPYISKVTLKFYEDYASLISAFNKKEVESLNVGIPKLLANMNISNSYKIQDIKQPRYFSIFLNGDKNSILDSKNVRIALNHAADKASLVKKILMDRADPIDSPLLPGIIDIAEPEKKYAYDTNVAKKILGDEGWEFDSSKDMLIKKVEDEDGETDIQNFSIKLTTLNALELPDIAEGIKKQWEDIGIKVNIEILTVAEIQKSIQDRDYEALLFGEVISPNPDPFSFWHSSQTKSPGINIGLYNDKDVDKMLEEARNTLDEEKRKAIYNDLQNIIINDAPAIFLYTPHYIYIQPDKIKSSIADIIPVPPDRFNDIEKWYINTKRVLRKNTDNAK